ncbi:MAG: T9SS type A sorting domain-containing protein [bacterium]
MKWPLFFVTGVLLLLLGKAEAQWTYLGLPGQHITSMAILERDSLILLAGTYYYPDEPERGGIFRSANNGITWTRVAVPQRNVEDLLKTPLLSGTILAPTNVGLLRSRDTGLTWDTLTTIGIWSPWHTQWRIAINPLDTLDWFLGTGSIEGEGQIFRSRDGGDTWNTFWGSFDMSSEGLGFSNTLPGILYGMAGFGTIDRFDIRDSTEAMLRYSSAGYRGFAIHPSKPYVCFGTHDTLLRYDEFHASWSCLTTSTPFIEYDVLYTGPELDGWIFGTSEGIYSIDSTFATAEILAEGAPSGGSPHAVSSHGNIYASMAGGIYVWHLFNHIDVYRDIQPLGKKPIVFPNPAASIIYCQIEGPGEIRVYNILGQLVWSQKILLQGNHQIPFHMNNFANGSYFYVILWAQNIPSAMQSGSFRIIR